MPCEYLFMSFERKNDNERLSSELLALQKGENNGRGIPCVEDIAQYWKMGEIESARQIAWTDNDKIRNYPDLQQWLEDNLFGLDIDSPLKLHGRIENWGKPENA
ncbi:MAG: hypothetical protein A2942_03725 [Candidatus Lloydbacteria bacterium RIFCSPLOWO2_01_FULL_50_20]|uniref:Uncharacterized protein n=1 Tax=Candidatus Lloydbacteria bacterium RIFCSPLOWO2_01_FULL_50_20 TaxID=1798665 RepID=A0A1G2DC71_9BACT|nr:MAG: hypothetical protein A2942_03725 [Candidatus Lloydbacteria bacterium RIFCSPLOWO2_01_FULL_50_20]